MDCVKDILKEENLDIKADRCMEVYTVPTLRKDKSELKMCVILFSY